MENHEDHDFDTEYLDDMTEECIWMDKRELEYLINRVKYFLDMSDEEHKKIKFEKTMKMLYESYESLTRGLPKYRTVGMADWTFEKFSEFVKVDDYRDNPEILREKYNSMIEDEFKVREAEWRKNNQ